MNKKPSIVPKNYDIKKVVGKTPVAQAMANAHQAQSFVGRDFMGRRVRRGRGA